MSRLAGRLKRRLEREGLVLPPVVRIERTYAGRNQRAAGAWSWQLATVRADGSRDLIPLGSQHRAAEVVCAPRLSFWHDSWDTHVFVEDPAGPARANAAKWHWG